MHRIVEIFEVEIFLERTGLGLTFAPRDAKTPNTHRIGDARQRSQCLTAISR